MKQEMYVLKIRNTDFKCVVDKIVGYSTKEEAEKEVEKINGYWFVVIDKSLVTIMQDVLRKSRVEIK